MGEEEGSGKPIAGLHCEHLNNDSSKAAVAVFILEHQKTRNPDNVCRTR